MKAEENIKFEISTEYSIALEVARNNGGMILPNKPGRDSAKDFVIWVPVKYEVKCDKKSKTSRNIFMETWNPLLKKASGLTATKSDWWLMYTPGDGVIYRFKPSIMLKWLTEKSGISIYKNAGDMNSDGYIVPLSTLSKLPFVTVMPFMG
jgi:hypothetical protein